METGGGGGGGGGDPVLRFSGFAEGLPLSHGDR